MLEILENITVSFRNSDKTIWWDGLNITGEIDKHIHAVEKVLTNLKKAKAMKEEVKNEKGK